MLSGLPLAQVEGRLARDFAGRAIAYPPASVAFLVLKDEGRLEVWAENAEQWVFVRSYLVRAASGHLGPKLRQGDHQVPEGVYRVDWFNPNSRYHLSMHLDYPNAFDQERAAADGRTQLGGDIMIHGAAVSDGCVPVGDGEVEQLFVLAARVGAPNVTVVIAPMDLRRIDPVAAARVVGGRPWLPELYASIADALRAFPLPGDDPGVATARRVTVARPTCRPYDVEDCAGRCRSGDVASCTRAGLMYADGRGVTADPATAWTLLQDACARGDAMGCAELGRLYVSDDGFRRNVARAADLARAACDAGDGHGCSFLAQLCGEGLLYPRTMCSEDVERRLRARAIVLLAKSCEGWGAYDCATLATIYAVRDQPAALRFAAGACDAGDPGGCDDLGRLYEDAGDLAQADALYQRACRAGYAAACARGAGRWADAVIGSVAR